MSVRLSYMNRYLLCVMLFWYMYKQSSHRHWAEGTQEEEEVKEMQQGHQ